MVSVIWDLYDERIQRNSPEAMEKSVLLGLRLREPRKITGLSDYVII
jgi:hypothetical protein